MMGIVVPETCWAYKKYNKIINKWYLVGFFILQLFKYSFVSTVLSVWIINEIAGQCPVKTSNFVTLPVC